VSPRPKATTFNTTGFTVRPTTHVDGFSLIKTSPFRSDGEAWQGGAKELEPDRTRPHMAWVQAPQTFKKNGKPRRRERFLVRVACEHLADDTGQDCRYACETEAQTGAFRP